MSINSTFELLFGDFGTTPPSQRNNLFPYQRQLSAAMPAGAPQYPCADCDRAYRSPQALQNHVDNAKNHTRPKQLQSAGANGAATTSRSNGTSAGAHCDVCDRGFVNSSALDAHRASEKHKKRAEQAKATVAPQPVKAKPGNTTGSHAAVRHGNNNWSVVPEPQRAKAFKALKKHCHSTDDLIRYHYSIKTPTLADINGLRKCKNCGGRAKNATLPCVFHPPQPKYGPKTGNGVPPPCCGLRSPGCKSLPSHSFAVPDRSMLEKLETPAGSGQPKRLAVTLDCEMAGIAGDIGELVLLSVADYMTGETLINTLVRPTDKIVNWRTKYSGVTAKAMADAIARGDYLDGWKGARAELWKYIDANTILIGHSLHHDLDILRVIHTRVVDSAILAKNAVGTNRLWALKTLCQDLMGIKVQTNGKGGHDCMEDALAAREVVLWCIQNPQLLSAWAKKAREQEERTQRLQGVSKESNKVKT